MDCELVPAQLHGTGAGCGGRRNVEHIPCDSVLLQAQAATPITTEITKWVRVIRAGRLVEAARCEMLVRQWTRVQVRTCNRERPHFGGVETCDDPL